jgi:hypothetical protein
MHTDKTSRNGSPELTHGQPVAPQREIRHGGNRGWASESACKSLPAPDDGSVAQPVNVSRPQPLARCLRQP